MNILILAEGQLGDLLLLTPAVRALRNGHPDARITVLIFHRHRAPLAGEPQTGRRAHAVEKPGSTGAPELVTPADGSGTSAVMTLHPCVGEVLEADRPRLRALRGIARLRGELSVLKAIRARRFDTVLCTFPEDRFAALAFLSGAAIRVGQNGQSLAWMLTRRPRVEKKEIGVLTYYCALAEAAGGRVDTRETEFAVPAAADAAALRHLHEAGVPDSGWVAVHPGASGDYKIWPPERYAALLAGLLQNRLQPVLLGGSGDDAILEAIGRGSRSGVPVIRTGSDVPLLGALLRRAALCITNDSGPRHLAVAVGAPSLALFRKHHGNEWKIYPDTARCVTLAGEQPCAACPPSACLDRIPEGEHFGSHCLRQLTVEQVLAAALAMLAPSRPADAQGSVGPGPAAPLPF